MSPTDESQTADAGEPGTALATKFRPAFEKDKWFYRSVVWFLGAALIISAVGAVVLATSGREIPNAVVALGSAAIGALAGVLVQNK